MSDADADAAAQAKRKYAPLSSKAPRWGATQFLLLGNLIAMSGSAYFLWQKADAGISRRNDLEAVLEGVGAPPQEDVERALRRPVKTAAPPREKGVVVAPRAADAGGRPLGDGRPRHAGIGKVDANGFYFVTPKEGERDFYKIGRRTGTDKVTVPTYLPGCLKNDASCTRPGCVRAECRPWGHHYDTIYQQRLGPYSRDDVEPFQFLEIGFYNGAGYDTYREFLPRGECHSIEIACIEQGPREEGKWPWGNFAEKNPRYQQYLDEGRLHCGDGNDVKYIDKVWREMKRPDAPPLMFVVDDGAHIDSHMAQSVFYWFPRIAPRGLMIVEDIWPISEANAFRTQFLPQIMKDLHYCGIPKDKQAEDELCFPTLFPLLASVHCELHICIFERSITPRGSPAWRSLQCPRTPWT